ncbi:MAG: hypothetical protein WBM90_00225 [Acidimicrobiia bacterium]
MNTAILLVFTVPALYVSWRNSSNKRIRQLLIAASSVGFVSALISTSSQDLLGKCETVNGRACLDYGSTGLRLTIMVLYVVVALIAAVRIADE